MEVIKTAIEGLVIIEPKVFKDARGYFFESFSQREFEEKVRKINFVQDNESMSSKGVLRGLHFQKRHTQAKLIRVTKGTIFDVAVDCRPNSPTFSKWTSVILDETKKKKKYTSSPPQVIAENKLNRNFYATKPNEKWVTDVTEFAVGDEKVYLSPVMDLFNREIVSYSISLSPNLWQIKEMLDGLFEKLPTDARPIFHSDQGWQYQHAEYQRLLAEHNITQSMSRKGNCMDNGAMENFFGRLKVEMFYGEKFESVNAFIDKLNEYIYYYNNERISTKLKGMSPVQYRTHSLAI